MNVPLAKNVIVIAYTYAAYTAGLGLLLVKPWLANFWGVILLAHAMIFSVALTHEFIHDSVFRKKETNAFWGQAMTYLNGGCYAPWESLVEHHFNHHLHHADFVKFDVSAYLNAMSPWRRWIYAGLEWLYFPLFALELRWRIMLAPFFDVEKRSQRWRTATLMLCRMAVFTGLAWVSWKALLLYFLSYVSFINVVRFIDAFHHTYEYVIVGHDFPQRDRRYEQSHTFSNLVSTKYPWLNLLFLNFGYHNAHHHNMSVPWHELPRLHHKLYASGGGGLLPLAQLISNYHRFRISRLFCGQGEASLSEEEVTASFTGGVAVSLLTPP